MKFMMVGDGVGINGKESYGEIYWVNHIFLPNDAIIMSDGKISQGIGLDHTALCGKYCAALNADNLKRPKCSICIKIADGIGKKGK